MQRPIIGFALSLAMIASSAYAVEFQDFANDPTPDGWVGFNNTVHSNSYGWSSATNNTNNDAALGEGGGFVARTSNEANNYYADVTLAGPLTLNNSLSASGWFRFNIPVDTGVPNPNFHFGFFYREAVELPQDNNNALGFVLADQSTTEMRLGARVVDDGGTNMFSIFAVLDHQTNYFFDLDYDPSAGSNGVLSLTLDDDGNSGNGVLHTLTVDVTAGQRASNAALTAFGLVNFNGGDSVHQNVFFDDLTYTSNQIVPEPTSLTLAVLGSVALIAVKRRRSRSL